MLQLQVGRLKVDLGALVMTSGISHLIHNHDLDVGPFLARHARGDWGDLCDGDAELNNQALKGGGRLLSRYTLPSDLPERCMYIITEADRSCTTLLLPSEY